MCTRGGTGRRARFRSVWINLRGSSNLLACTIEHGIGIGTVFFIILDAAKKGEENHDLKTEDKKIITAGRLSKKDCK